MYLAVLLQRQVVDGHVGLHLEVLFQRLGVSTVLRLRVEGDLRIGLCEEYQRLPVLKLIGDARGAGVGRYGIEIALAQRRLRRLHLGLGILRDGGLQRLRVVNQGVGDSHRCFGTLVVPRPLVIIVVAVAGIVVCVSVGCHRRAVCQQGFFLAVLHFDAVSRCCLQVAHEGESALSLRHGQREFLALYHLLLLAGIGLAVGGRVDGNRIGTFSSVVLLAADTFAVGVGVILCVIVGALFTDGRMLLFVHIGIGSVCLVRA